MTEKNIRFCEEYLIDLNATQAAIRAGYKDSNSVRNTAADLLAKPDISVYINKLMAQRSKRTGVNADRVVRELAKIAFVNATDVISKDGDILVNAAEEDTAAISGVKVKKSYFEGGNSIEKEVRLHDKVKALELLGRHLKMFTDKFEVLPGVTIISGEEKLED